MFRKQRSNVWMKVTTIAGVLSIIHVLSTDARETPVAQASEKTVPDTTPVAATPYHSELSGRSAEDTVSEYLEIVREGRSSVETVAYLVDWLRANPEQTDAMLELVADGAFEGEQQGLRGLFAALGQVRTPQTTDALMDLLTTPGGSMEHRVSAAKALWAQGPTGRPTTARSTAPDDSLAMLTTLVGLPRSVDSGALAYGTVSPETSR